MKEPHFGPDGKKLIRRLAASFGECADDARKYGACIKLHYESVQKSLALVSRSGAPSHSFR